jgi:S1-C subfamily serine protease
MKQKTIHPSAGFAHMEFLLLMFTVVVIGAVGAYVHHIHTPKVVHVKSSTQSPDTSNITTAKTPLTINDFNSVIGNAKASVVKIEGYDGCPDILWGTGFVVGPDLVATNAHVVAGITDPQVIDNAGKHAATPVVFDPTLDFAVLRVSGITGSALPLNSTGIGSVIGSHNGNQDIVLGYPNAGDFTPTLATITSEYESVSNDIYGNPNDQLDLYQINAAIQHGNSGSPLIQADGKVAGIIEGVSPDDSSTAYAIPTNDFLSEVQQATHLSAVVSTQACANSSS